MRGFQFGLLLTGLTIWCVSAQAEQDVMMFGLKIEQADFVGGRVQSTLKHGRTVTIDLGASEGLRPTHRLWLFRRVDGQFHKIGRIEVATTLREASVAITENLVRARRGDLAVIAAKDLDVWHGEDILLRRIKNRIVDNQIANRYSTFQREFHGRALLQQLSTQRDIKHAFWRQSLLRLRPAGPAYFDISILKSMSRQRPDRRAIRFHPDRLAVRDPERLFDTDTGEFIGFPLELYLAKAQETAASTSSDDDSQDPPVKSNAAVPAIPKLRTPMYEYELLRKFLQQQS